MNLLYATLPNLSKERKYWLKTFSKYVFIFIENAVKLCSSQKTVLKIAFCRDWDKSQAFQKGFYSIAFNIPKVEYRFRYSIRRNMYSQNKVPHNVFIMSTASTLLLFSTTVDQRKQRFIKTNYWSFHEICVTCVHFSRVLNTNNKYLIWEMII